MFSGDLKYVRRRGERWLGWQDSNLRMPGSKPGALPLGDTPFKLFTANPRFAALGFNDGFNP